MLRISVTSLEKFRRCTKGLTSFDTEEALIDSLKGEFKGNDKTRTGEAFHAMIEDPATVKIERHGLRDWYMSEGIGFTHEHYSLALAFRNRYPSMIYEVPVFKVYNLGRMEIMVSGRIDGINAREEHDNKTKYRQVDFEEYLDSYQWRFYLDILNLDKFQYNIFEVKGFGDALPDPPLLKDVQIIDHEPLICTRYINLEHDCETLLNEFIEYIENRNLFHVLKQANEYSQSFFY